MPWAGFHTLRHTFASRALSEGSKTIVQVARLLGHADPGFTLRTHVHLIDEGVGDAAFLCRDRAAQGGEGAATQAR